MTYSHPTLVSAPRPERPARRSDPLRVLLVDDHRRMRQGLAAVLAASGDLVVAEEPIEAASILRRITAWEPDVVFLAVRLGSGTGLDLVAHVHARAPDTPIVVLTMQRSPAYMQRAIERGARGVVLKDHADTELLPAVRAAAGGESYLSPVISRPAARSSAAPPRS